MSTSASRERVGEADLRSNTRTTTWVDPRRQQFIRVLGPTGNTTAVQQTSVSNLGALPSGWEMRLTSTARVYFVDQCVANCARSD